MELTIECMLATMKKMKETDPEYYEAWLKRNNMTEEEAEKYIENTLKEEK